MRIDCDCGTATVEQTAGRSVNACSPSSERIRLNWGVIGAVATTILLWASAFVAIRAGLRGYKPAELAALRYIVASVILGMRAVVRGVQIPEKRDWPRLIACACLGFAMYSLLLNYGETRVSAGTASFIVYTVPLFTAVLATIVLREQMGVLGWIGIGVSLSGTSLLSFATNRRLEFEPAVITLIVAALALALYFNLQKPLVVRYGALTITSWGIWLSTFLLLPFFPWKTALAAPATAIYSAIYLGAFPTVVAYSAWAYAVARMPVARTTACLYFVPGTATLIGFIVLGERPTVLGIIGGLVAMAGVVFVNQRHKPIAGNATKQALPSK